MCHLHGTTARDLLGLVDLRPVRFPGRSQLVRELDPLQQVRAHRAGGKRPRALAGCDNCDVPWAWAEHLDAYDDDQRDQALADRSELERLHRLEPHMEVVLLSARSRAHRERVAPREPRPSSSLPADPARRAALEAVVAKHDLRIGGDIGGGFTPKGAVMGFRACL